MLKSKNGVNLNIANQPKILIQTGISQIDIYTGRLVTGARGETIINGGLNIFTGMVGYSNNYKTTIMHFLLLSASNKMASTLTDIRLSLYDTENNVIIERLQALAMRFNYLYSDDMFDGEEPTWFVTDKANVMADEWINGTVEYLKEKASQKNDLVEFTCFINKSTGKPIKVPRPSFFLIDSLSEMETAAKYQVLDKENLDDAKTIFMMDGLAKTKLLARIPTLAKKYGAYFGMTAHLGEKIDMGGKYDAKPSRKLQHLPAKDKIKGGTDKLIYLSSISYHTGNTKLLQHKESKQPLYPINKEATVEKDLNIVPMTVLRNKTGTSGQLMDIVVSQMHGVDPELTNFVNVKEANKGISGNNINYHLDIYPESNLSRTTIRGKIKEDNRLARAIEITADIINAERYMPVLKADGLICDFKTLYEDIKKMGYCWEDILDSRGWFAPDNYAEHLPPFLSFVDLLRMRKGLYHPYWLADDYSKYKNPILKTGEQLVA